MSILDALFGRQNNGQQAQVPGSQQQPGFLGQLLDPSVALPMAGALMGNQGNSANFGNAFSAAGPAMAQQKLTAQGNKTGTFLRKQDPRYAEMLDNGFQPKEVYELYLQDRKAQTASPSYMSMGDGYALNENTGEFLASPGAGKSDDYTQRQQAAEQYGLTPEDPRYQPFLLTGKFPREDAQELTATDKKAMWAAEDEIPILDNTIASLDRAKVLNDKTYTGWGASVAGRLGTQAPGGSIIFDPETSAATEEFGKLMSMEAIQAMAQTLKGATTDSELARFVNILADPSTPPKIRGNTIDRMKLLAERVKQVKTSRINSIQGIPQGGYGSQGGQGGGGLSTTSTGATWRLK